MEPITFPVINRPNWLFRCGYMHKGYWFACFAEDNPDGSNNIFRAKGADSDYISAAHLAAQATSEVEFMLRKFLKGEVPMIKEGEDQAESSLQWILDGKTDNDQPIGDPKPLMDAVVQVRRDNIARSIRAASQAQQAAKRAAHLCIKTISTSEDALPTIVDLVMQTSDLVRWTDHRKELEALHDAEVAARPDKVKRLLRGL